MNIVDEIARRATPAHPALVADGRTMCFGELFERVGKAAEWMESAVGHQPDTFPRIGLACSNGSEYIILALAILKAGGCLVPLAEELTTVEREEVIARTRLSGMVLGRGETWRRAEATSAMDFIGAVWVPLENPLFENENEFKALAPAFIRFSSGTTGRSKGVVLSHLKLLERITAANEILKIGPTDRVLWMLPMAHHFAVSIILYLYHGACTVLGSSHLAEQVLETAEATQATVIYGAPFHYSLLAADQGSYTWPDLRLAVATAAPLPAAVAENFFLRFQKSLVQGFGIIEVGLPILNIDDAQQYPTSVGRPLPAYQVEIRSDAGVPMGADEIGELWIKGPGLFDAYLSPWQSVAAVCAAEWFCTGDLAQIDSSGLVFLRGRTKSVLNVSGMKVFPEEVEAVINSHPAVQRCRVTGIDHAVLGCLPTAEVILESTLAATQRELTQWCKGHLSNYKIPVRFTFVTTLPTTASGKISRA